MRTAPGRKIERRLITINQRFSNFLVHIRHVMMGRHRVLRAGITQYNVGAQMRTVCGN